MSDLTERVAGAISVAPHSPEDCPPSPEAIEEHRHEARAAIREVLAAMRNLSSDTLNHAADDWRMSAGGLDSLQTRILRNHRSVIDAFAREHGIEP